MKKILCSILICLSLLSIPFINTSCTTTSGGSSIINVDTNGLLYVGGFEVSPNVIGGVITEGIKFGLSTKIVTVTPDIQNYMNFAANVINASIANGNFNPTNLTSQISLIPINAGSATTVIQQLIIAAISDYSTYYSAFVSAKVSNASPYLIPILQGIANGISSTSAVSVSVNAANVNGDLNRYHLTNLSNSVNK
jgi:hypothetical protein